MTEFKRSGILKSIQLSILLLMDVLAICGNIFVCWAVYRKRKALAIPHLFVLALATSDLSVAVLCYPFCIRAFVEDRWIYSFELCQFTGFVIYFWAGISVPTLALTAVNRYFRIVRSRSYRTYFTLKSSVTMITSIWLLTVFDGFLSTFVGPVIYEYNPNYFFCIGTFTSKTKEKAIGISLHIIHVFLPLLLIVFCYSRVFCFLRCHAAKVMHTLRAGQIHRFALNAREMYVTRLLFFVVVGFLVCWIPVIVIGIIAHSSKKLPTFAYEMYTFLAFASSVINPFIYGVVNREFRREFLRILWCK